MSALVLAWHPVPPQRPDTPWDWTALAACQYTDAEVFFPDERAGAADAKRVCRTCEVRADCLAYALEHEIFHGVWGGLSEQERRGAVEQRGGTRLCRNKLHVIDDANRRPNGGCLACKRASDARASERRRAGTRPSPQTAGSVAA